MKSEVIICTNTLQFQSSQEDYGQKKIPIPMGPMLTYLDISMTM